ncbi:MAG: cob(I)yrinic acid a,c-diamide adenosyltransferase [Fimbriimonadaceae bacterium]|nr:cob(I)yrinic acid a,c-diamide adenosyltransferase [Fimbriimonadaceae bacterium]QYK59355.1 MAG: cob(I)yrinic acid a,c-diamide adenosyltransferase [Fimbriimonadaceae bacterium]
MRLYTKTGDDGTTGLIGGSRVGKSDVVIQAVGSLDELNACLGLTRLSADAELSILLLRVQDALFACGAEVACPEDGRLKKEAHLGPLTAVLEASIDQQTANLAELRNFILPGGSLLASQLHWARTVCRRAERTLVELHQTQTVRSDVLQFVNRLSDWLFVCARSANAAAGIEDVPWREEVGA